MRAGRVGRRGGAPYAGLQQASLDEVRGRGLLEATIFSSFSDEVLAELRELEPEARLATLVHPLERAIQVGAEAVNPYFTLATPEQVAAAHAAGLAVYVYTVDDPDMMRRLFSIEVDGIFSNCPDILRNVVDSLGV